MKPKNWDSMEKGERIKYAQELGSTMRGGYIIAQALQIAIDRLEAVPRPYQETSNLEDMMVLRELFDFPIVQQGVVKTGSNLDNNK